MEKRNKHKKLHKRSNNTENTVVSTCSESPQRKYFIKFKNGELRSLRKNLLKDLSKEYHAILLGKTVSIGGSSILNVYDARLLRSSDYENQSPAFLRLKKDFVHKTLVELTHRLDVDTMIDVHTHPFSESSANFSGIDDNDEKVFSTFLFERFNGIHYASIVLSQTQYSSRIWTIENSNPIARCAFIKTQTPSENILSTDFKKPLQRDFHNLSVTDTHSAFHRSVITLGLDVMKKILDNQVISIVGVGGLGSVIAEHLIHMGFHKINLIDHDVLDVSNLNRFVGAYYKDAQKNSFKVDVVKEHLEKINPLAKINALKNDIYDIEIEEAIALSDWILVATDNHSSRFRSQQLSIKYFVPLISAGVNITVSGEKIIDMSGEVITARVGDYLCLNCLGRINPINVASERHPDEKIREQIVKRGYVTGKDIKEPAVKTLNTMLATMLVDVLVNQYTEFQKNIPILVYENNASKSIYEDKESVRLRSKNCYTCNI